MRMIMMFNSLPLIATKAITIMVIREEVQDTVAHQVKEAAWPVTSSIVTLSSGITIFWNNSGIVSNDSSDCDDSNDMIKCDAGISSSVALRPLSLCSLRVLVIHGGSTIAFNLNEKDSFKV